MYVTRRRSYIDTYVVDMLAFHDKLGRRIKQALLQVLAKSSVREQCYDRSICDEEKLQIKWLHDAVRS